MTDVSKIAALLCSIVAVTQISGCSLINSSDSATQAINYDVIMAPASSFFKNRPSSAQYFENIDLAATKNVDHVICMSYTYGTYLTVEERYGYSSDSFVFSEAVIYPGECNTPSAIAHFTQGTVTEDDLKGELGGYYKLLTDTGVLLPGISTLSLTQAAKAIKTIVDDVTANPGTIISEAFSSTESTFEVDTAEVTETNGLAIESLSEDTLTMSNYTMRVSLGEKRQISIAQCPRDFVNKVLFISDNPSIASVDSKGYVTAHKSGTATITVTLDGAAGYSSVMIYVY